MRRGLRTLVVCALVPAAWLLGAAPVLGDTHYPAELNGAAVVPGPGDTDASGVAVVSFSPPDGMTCLGLELSGATGVTSITIHAGGPGETGALKATLPIPPDLEGSTDCKTGDNPALLESIVADPEGHYLQVATEEFPDGAVRGQLGAPVHLTMASAHKFACPPGIDAPEEIADNGSPCSIVVAGDEDVDPPDGYTWDNPPLSFSGMSITVTDGLGTLTLDDADRDGGGFCDPATLRCVFGRFYSWQEVLVGPTTIREVTHPAGYRLGWVSVIEATEPGSPVAYEVDLATGTVSFDSTNHPGGVSVTFFDVVAASPTPAPTATATQGQTSSATPVTSPRVTLPPTSIASDADAAEHVAALAVSWLLAATSILLVTLAARAPRRHR
jgi:hypothetical protein